LKESLKQGADAHPPKEQTASDRQDSYRKFGFALGPGQTAPQEYKIRQQPIQTNPSQGTQSIPISSEVFQLPGTTRGIPVYQRGGKLYFGTSMSTGTTTGSSGTITTTTTGTGGGGSMTTTTSAGGGGSTTTTGTPGGATMSSGGSTGGSMGPVTLAPSVYVHGLSYNGGEPPTYFIDAFRNLALVNNWDESRKVCNLLLHLKEAAADCIRNNIRILMRKENYNTEEDLFASPHAPKFNDLLDWLRRDFSVQEAPEVLQRQLERCRYENYASAAQYYHAKIYLMNRLDSNMPENRRISHLIKGMPRSLGQQIYLNNPKDAQTVLSLIGQFERFNSLYGAEANTLEQDLRNMMSHITTT